MGKIDTSVWKEFRIGDLFEACLSKDDIQPKDFVEGEIPLVSSGKENNGIIAFVEDKEARLWDKNTLTIDMFGKVFYQENPYFAVSHGRVNILLPKISMTKGCLQFMGCAIEKVALQKYAFNEMCTGTKVLKDNIKLPATPDGAPDWAYMESYMANLETKVAESLTMLQTAKDAEKKKVDTREWGEFKFGDLFDLHGIKQAKSQKLIPTVELSDGIPCVPYIVQSQFNNMVGRYVDKQWLIENNEPPVEGNALVLGVTLNACSYQPEEFGASQVITARSPCLNKNNGFFIAAIVRKRIEQFDYKEKPSFEKYRALKIMLPIDKTGQPDWAYMEEYMRKVEERVKKTINTFCVIRKIKYDC